MKTYDEKDEKQREFIQTYASASIKTSKDTWSQIENTEPNWKKHKTEEETHPHTQRQRQEETKLYTDGSCPTNSKVNEENCPAGWGIAIYETETEDITLGLFGPVETKHNATHFLGAEFGSNNTGELTAICEGLKWIIANEQTTKPAAFYYDSKYAAKITTGEYKAESNKYLAAKAKQLLQQAQTKRTIRFEHIKGHSNDVKNDAADELANKGALRQTCRNTEEWNNIKQTHPEISEKKKDKERERENKASIWRLKLSELRTQEVNKVHIARPIYGYGATRRSKFAFGRITSSQARTNTNQNQYYNERRTEEENIEEETTEDTFLNNTHNEPQQSEPEEENPFIFDDEPDQNECA